ncbi:MAG: regulatory protein GemA [Candidatus Cloacimonetes bacterium]|nr:regulatory protein GemA [Candidatus Cloacimonadota bacterium]
MTEKQIKYAKMLRSKIVAYAKMHCGWSKEQLYEIMAGWGHTKTLSKCWIPELKTIQATLRSLDSTADYDRVIVGGKGMSTAQQQRYAIVLYHAYCRLKGKPRNEWGAWMRNWLHKYWKVDHVRWITERKMHTVLGAIEKMIITTFGVEAYEKITQREWPEHGHTYRKHREA